MQPSPLHPRPVPSLQHQEVSCLGVRPQLGSYIPGMEHKLHEAAALAVQQGGLGALPVVLHQSQERSSFILNIHLKAGVALSSKEDFVFGIMGDFAAEITIGLSQWFTPRDPLFTACITRPVSSLLSQDPEGNTLPAS